MRLEFGLNFALFHSLAGVFLACESYSNEFRKFRVCWIVDFWFHAFLIAKYKVPLRNQINLQ